MKDVAFWALFIGILNLAYGLSIVSGGAILLLLLNRWREKLLATKPFILAFSVTLTLVILPYLLWVGIVVLLTGSFYSHEITAWKQVVWIKDVTQQGLPWLVLKLAGNLWFFFSSMAQQLLQIATIPLLLLYFSIPVWPMLRTKLHEQRKLIGWASILIPVFFIFYSVVGYTVSRLAFAGTTLVILLLSLWGSMLIGCLKSERQHIFLFASSFLILLHSTLLLVKTGPNS